MSDTRSLTNPKLQISGRIEDGDESIDDRVPSMTNWISAVLRIFRCKHRSKEWIASRNDLVDGKPVTLVTKENDVEELNFNWLAPTATSDDFKVLLVFPRNDQQSEIIERVAHKLGWSVGEARNAEEAVELYRTQRHELVVVDRRPAQRAREADEICRTLVDISNSNSYIVALVKKSFFTGPHKNDDAVLELLSIGYNRAMLECSHEGLMTNELIGMRACRNQPRSNVAAAQLLYLALDRHRDAVHVTNDRHVVMFANGASEWSFGYRRDELLGRRLEEFVTNDSLPLVEQQLRRGREFVGGIGWRRKNKPVIYVGCRVVPASVPASKTIYYVYFYEHSAAIDLISPRTSFDYHSPRGSLQSTQSQPSIDLRYLNKSRRSTATVTKLHNLLLEAPITRIVTVLTNIMNDSDNPEVNEQIEMAIEILKKAELYSPRLREGDPLVISDPLTADLLGALVSVSTNDPRKPRAMSLGKQSTIIKILNANQSSIKSHITSNPGISTELDNLLATGFDWDFDIFKLEILTNKRPLFHLGMMLMNEFKVSERLECDERVLGNWLTIIEANYNSHVIYHNSTHATDVLQAIARFLRSDRLRNILDPMDEVAALLAAAAHDVGHPGKSSQFLCNADDKLAILYNDLTVLESHHSSLTFKVTLADDNVNILKNLNRDMYKFMRHNIIDMILATEMTKHFEHLARFVNVCSNRIDDPENQTFDNDSADSVFLLPENVTMAKRMMIKCADVSNPTRPMRLYVEWTRRIAIEYFDQTDEEKRRTLPVVMPLFDRTTCSIPKSQIGFVDYIINDMMEAWDTFIDMPELIGNMRQNYEKWKRLDEQGISTLDDIEKLQQSLEFQLYRIQIPG